MAQDQFSTLLYRTSVCGSLLGATATLYLIGGLGGFIESPLLNVPTAVGISLAAVFFLYAFFVSMLHKSWWRLLLWLLILLVLGVEIVLGFLPPTARDELTHHLAIPRLYVKAGRILEVPFAPYSYYPMLLDMLYTPWVRWGWDSIPKLIHGLYGFLTALLLYAYLSRRLSPIYGLLGFFFFIFTPAILRLGHWAYVDLGVAFYSTASLLCLLRWIEAREIRNPPSSIRNFEFRWLMLAGLSAGFALATKPNGLLVFLVLFFVLAFLMASRVHRDGIGKVASQVLLFAFLALVSLSPWLLKNLAWTGNPLFPFFTGLLGGGGESGGEPGLGLLDRRRLLYGESWWQISTLPLRVFFFGQDDRPQYFDGVLNPLLILFLPWAFKGKWDAEKKILFGFSVFYLLYAVFLVELRIRYILPIVPPLVILLVYSLHNIYLRIVHPSLLFGTVLILLAMNGVYLWNYFREVSPLDYLRGRESREAYLTRVLPDYPSLQFINQRLPSTAKVYFLFMGRRVYYCEREYFHDGGEYAGTLLRMIRGARDENDIQAKLKEKGLTHLLARDDLLTRFLSTNLTPEQAKLWVSFANRQLKALFHSRGYSVYQIYG
jgi:hypothetical protein